MTSFYAEFSARRADGVVGPKHSFGIPQHLQRQGVAHLMTPDLAAEYAVEQLTSTDLAHLEIFKEGGELVRRVV